MKFSIFWINFQSLLPCEAVNWVPLNMNTTSRDAKWVSTVQGQVDSRYFYEGSWFISGRDYEHTPWEGNGSTLRGRSIMWQVEVISVGLKSVTAVTVVIEIVVIFLCFCFNFTIKVIFIVHTIWWGIRKTGSFVIYVHMHTTTHLNQGAKCVVLGFSHSIYREKPNTVSQKAFGSVYIFMFNRI